VWEPLKQHFWQWRGIGVTAAISSSIVIGLRLVGALQVLELAALDYFFQQRPVEPPDSRIVLVTVDEADINYLRRWTISDADLAKVLQNISQQQPRAIGLDFYRDLPVQPGHEALLKVFRSTPNLIGIQKVVGNLQDGAIAPPTALAALNQSAASDTIVDDDGTVRRALLSTRNADGKTVLGFATRLALLYLKPEGITVQTRDRDRGYLQLGKAMFQPLQAHDGGYVNVDVGGYQILSNFRRFSTGQLGHWQTISLTAVLENRIPATLMRDRIVLVGTTAASLGDRLNTPIRDGSGNIPGTPGVFLQANIVSQLVSAALEGRPVLRAWAESWEWVAIVSAAVGGSTIGWLFRSPWRTGFCGTLLASGVVVVAYGGLVIGWWIPVLPMVVALLGAAVLSESYMLWNSVLGSKRQLADYAQTLEQKVRDRTHELTLKNQQLEQEIYERQQTELQLQHAKAIAEEANIAKSEFLATMSHELRTPLTSIFGALQMIGTGVYDNKPVKAKQMLQIAINNSDRLMRLINNLLDLERLESNEVELSKTNCDVADLIQQAVETVQAIADNAQMRLSIAPISVQVWASSSLIVQVLTNLLSNAVKFSPEGSTVWLSAEIMSSNHKTLEHPTKVESHIAATLTHPAHSTTQLLLSPTASAPPASLTDSRSYLLFAVRDRGCGIPADKLDTIFGRFQQVDRLENRHQRGTGLGLAICKSIVEQHSGKIWVESSPEGSTFYFTLPLDS
jgi:adenylate cyclase